MKPVSNVNDKAEKNKFQQPGRVKTVQGSILTPENAGLRFVLNTANMVGKTENVLYPLFDKKWASVKREVKGWFNNRNGFYKLGVVNTLAVQSDVWVISMLCQDDKLQTQLEALKKCLQEVCKMAKSEKATVHVSTLLTKEVPELNALLASELVDNGVSVNFYEEK